MKTRKDIINTLVKKIGIILIVGVVYLFAYGRIGAGIPCVINKLTGYLCPGCGMTRALFAICHFDYKAAISYNALSLTVFPVLCIYLLYRSVKKERGLGEGFYIWEYVLLIGMVIVAVGYTYFRNH